MSGEWVWKVRSTPSPEEILRTMKEEFSPRLRLAMTMPSKACTRFLSPSTTLTLTTTVSPGEKSGTLRARRLISSCSMVRIRSMCFSAPVFLLELLQQPSFVFAQAARADQIGPPQPGPAQRLLQPPAPDVLVVPREQDLGHPRAGVRLRPRVLRAVEQPVGKRLLERRAGVAERPRQLPHHGVHQRHRRELPAGQHEIAQRQLLVDAPRQQPLVDALVASAQQRHGALLRKLQ